MAICDVGGIESLNADVLGSRNTLNLVHCVFNVRVLECDGEVSTTLIATGRQEQQSDARFPPHFPPPHPFRRLRNSASQRTLRGTVA